MEALGSLKKAQTLDIAFTEVKHLTALIQEQRSFELKDGTVLNIPLGEKYLPEIGNILPLRKNGKYSFSGRIRTGFNEAQKFSFQQQLVYGMKLCQMGRHLIRFDLGFPIEDQLNFKGCSGAPIFDDKGELVALVASGDANVASPYVYGFRLDRLISYINMMYFSPSLEKALASIPPKSNGT